MLKRMFAAVFVVAIVLAFSSTAFSQESVKMEAKKDNMHALKSVTCDPTCGFMVRSHDEKELVTMVKEHSKNVHNKEMTDKEVIAMIKPADMKRGDKMMKTKEEKK